ncbi:MAG: hypothetical protein R2836_06510 [Chitinophagales bacterium]
MADRWIEIPHCPEELSPLVSSIPLQLLSYHVALMRGCNKLTNQETAKSVTVE